MGLHDMIGFDYDGLSVKVSDEVQIFRESVKEMFYGVSLSTSVTAPAKYYCSRVYNNIRLLHSCMVLCSMPRYLNTLN